MKTSKLLLNILPLLVLGGAMVYAAAPSGGYLPGVTTDPACAPGDTDCFVQLVSSSGADNLGNHTATQNLNLSGSLLTGGGTSGIFVGAGGNVGIGTVTPIAKLQIMGSVLSQNAGTATGSASDFYAFRQSSASPAGNGPNIRLEDSSNVDYSSMLQSSLGNIQFLNYDSGWQERMIIQNTTGNVGIGTNTPSEKLEVKGTVLLTDGFGATNAAIVYKNNTDYLFLGPQSGSTANGAAMILAGDTNTDTAAGTGGITFAVKGASPAMVIKGDTGNVGIGTSSPQSKLDVNGDITATNGNFITTTNRPFSTNSNGHVSVRGDTGGWAFRYGAIGSLGTDLGGFGFNGSADTLGKYYIGTFNTDEKISILASNGNVGIGTTNPSSKLAVTDIGATTFEIVPSNASQIVLQSYNRDTANYTNMFFDASGYRFRPNGTGSIAQSVFIDDSGRVGIGVSNPNVKLDVVGNIKIANSNATCAAGNAGEIRYDTVTSKHQGCNGTIWNNLY